MGRRSQPRSGSLQIWPRKRAERFLPGVNWNAIKGQGLLGFIAYKVGMTSCLVKDLTANSLSKDKRIIVPVTVLEAPSMKIFSVRLYKNGLCNAEIVLSSDKELKRVIKIGKVGKIEDLDKKEFDDLRVIVYSQVGKTAIKKTPDMIEIGFGGKLEEKIAFVKEKAGKDIFVSGWDFPKETLELIEKGNANFTVAQNPYAMGYWALMVCYSYNHPPTPWSPEVKTRKGKVIPSIVDTGVVIISEDAVDEWK